MKLNCPHTSKVWWLKQTNLSNIYEYVTTETNSYQMMGVDVVDGYHWKMYDHIKLSTLYKNSQFQGGNYGDKPFKNIIRPILNVAYRSEGFDVKDIEPYVDDAKDYYKSFLVRKFHNKWAREHDLDTFIDEVVETYIDYGGVMVKNCNNERPEVVKWQQIAFVDQTDIMSGTIALKHQYSIDQLKETVDELGWYSDGVDTAIKHALAEKENSDTHTTNKTPGKYIEVYEVHGTFPSDWLKKDIEGSETFDANLDPDKYSKQVHIITYVYDEQNNKNGVCLFKGKEKEQIFKLLLRDKIYGRALGFGGVEELFEPQLWTNFNMIHMTNMLQQASKIIYQTADAGYNTRNNTKGAENGEIFIHEDGKPATLMNNAAINYPQFDKAVAEWEIHARTTGSANDAQLGITPPSGTPFALQNLVVSTGQGIHEFRRGKIATFISEIYRDWILQYLVTEINQGDEWVDELSLDEMQVLSEDVMNNAFNDFIKRIILNGGLPTEEELAPLRETFKKDFMKSSKKFITVAESEFSKIPIDVYVNVAGKQKDLNKVTEKLTNIFRQIISNPQVLGIPGISKIFNEILEASGLSPMDFSGVTQAPVGQAVPSPMQPQLQTNQPIQ